jgi:hypothetical protein
MVTFFVTFTLSVNVPARTEMVSPFTVLAFETAALMVVYVHPLGHTSYVAARTRRGASSTTPIETEARISAARPLNPLRMTNTLWERLADHPADELDDS